MLCLRGFKLYSRWVPLSCVNRPETVHGTLRFLYLSHLLYGICVKIFLMNRYISKSYTTSRQYTERGQLFNYYYFIFV